MKKTKSTPKSKCQLVEKRSYKIVQMIHMNSQKCETVTNEVVLQKLAYVTLAASINPDK